MHLHRRAATASAGALLAIAALLAGCGSTSAPPSTGVASGPGVAGAQHLDVGTFAGLAGEPGTVLLDVRTPEEFTAGHLTGARLLNFESADFDAQLAALDKGATYAIYCRSGNRSGQALSRMTAAGFTHVADLKGGILAWTGANRSLTT